MLAAQIAAGFVIGYLSGSIPFAWLAARSVGVDILSIGTGNPGAANVFRLVDKRLGVLVFLADVAKGAVPEHRIAPPSITAGAKWKFS